MKSLSNTAKLKGGDSIAQYAILRFAKQKGGFGALEAHHERTKVKYASNPKTQTHTEEVILPQTVINEFARFLVPQIRKFYESEEGHQALAEWREKQAQQSEN